MRLVFSVLLGLSLLQGSAFAFQGPEIQVVDGKITMSAQAVPLGQLLTLLDRAMGLKSEVMKPELANRNISVRFSGLDLEGAVVKIFEGQPLNYILNKSKGITVIEQASGGGITSAASSPITTTFSDSPITNAPLQPGVPTVQPIVTNAQGANAQPTPANPNNPFGAAPGPNPAAANTPSGPGQLGGTPGQIGPPVGGNNPLISPAGAPTQPAGVIFPGPQTNPAPQPAGPGASGATPGVIR